MYGVNLMRAVVIVGTVAACTGPVDPELVVQFAGKVEGLTTETRPATVTARAHAENDCAAGHVMDRVTTQTQEDDAYAFALTMPRGSRACVAVTIETETETTVWGDSVTVTDVSPGEPVQEGDGTVVLPLATLRIVIRRPSP